MKINNYKILNAKSNVWNLQALLFVLFLFTATTHAQDSIRLNNHLFDSQTKNQIFKYPIAYTNSYIKDFTFTELSYAHQQNEFARKQVAKEINTIEFLTQGHYTTTSKWKLFGNLSIQKKEEKDLSWVLSEDRTEEQEVLPPHYFFVPRKGDWDSQHYAITGGFSKEITAKIAVAVKAIFNADKYTRNVDPRPEITLGTLGAEIQLGYQLLENHKVFALTEYKQTNKSFTYLYKDDHLNFESFPETYLRFNSGYGRIINYFNSTYGKARFSYKDISDKIGLGYTFSNKNTNFTALYYSQKSTNNFYTSVFTTDADIRFKYKTKTNHAELFMFHKWNQKELKSTLKYENSSSINYDILSKGHNYKTMLNSLNWVTSISKKTNTKIDYLFGLDLNYQQNNYNDILATSNMDINSLNTGIFASRDFAFDKSKLNTTVSFNMYFPLVSSKLDYYDTSGGTNARFFDEVIIYDYAVNTTNYVAPALRLEYSYPVKNNKTVVFFTNLKEKLALKKQNDYKDIINTNTTYWIQCGVQLNY